ncbi:hypothetical protein MU0083_001748 [[Mycobacterium] kokjensenii]|uniref:DUF4365 domain-containing protein n=1 Tax=[Mycobacterium] kokjensenii TaxID=3064287 RepID=A0ABM9LES2_9MYCO|nr:hypothetical protein [Mycolicibacter sp. MU0083]CAJ1497725.1 hypothetical protein MU0083_001748 [Mycolicibacter sp. MU0083]
MASEAKLGTQAIGAAGELFVQYRLIKRGIDSARLTTDSGIDLAMYVPGTRIAQTVQVKATHRPYSVGPSGQLQVAWPFPADCKAEWLAVVDLSRDRAWMLPIDEALERSRPASPGVQLYWNLEEPRGRVVGVEADFAQYELDRVMDRLLAGQTPELP